MLRRFSLSRFLLASLLSCTGCGGTGGVEGRITLDGQPLPGVQVLFDQPELSVRENKGYVGRTDTEGKYQLSPAFGQGTEVPPATYRVSLTTAVFDPSAPAPTPPPGATSSSSPFYPESPPPPPERIPPAYRGGKLTFTVPEGGTDQANFELKSK